VTHGVERTTARVVLVDAEGRTLLLCGGDPSRPEGGQWWFTPGGGIEQGETVQDAARREVLEETGIAISDLGEVVLRQRIEYDFAGALVRQDEQFFVVQVPGVHPDEMSDVGWTDLERRSVVGCRWWSVSELGSTTETVYPLGLADLLDKHSPR